MSAPQNPPAFPVADVVDATGCGIREGTPGMTLRDYFAGQVLAGFMANTKRPTTIAPDDAEWCYIVADAMLVARAKGGAV